MLAVLLMNRMSNQRRLKARKVVKPAKITKKDLSVECCRTCLATEDLVAIFYSKETENKRSNELMLVTGLEIKMNDGLSQKICSHCLEIVTTALKFRRTSRKAEKTLLNMVIDETKTSVALTKAAKRPKQVKSETEDVKTEYNYEYNLFGDGDAGTDDHQDYECNNDYKSDVKNDYKLEIEIENVNSLLQPMESGPKKERMVIPNASSYKCQICNKEFRMKATFKAHLRFHTNYCVCETCGKRCRNNNQLQEHKRAKHGLGRIHKCAYCEYSSATKEALIIHERRHTGERPYICDHCGANFHRRSNLVQHIAIHLPEKNFQCSLCPARAKSRKLLLIHQYKYHRRNKYRYICPICQDTFTRPGNVRQHLVRTHSISREDQGVIDKLEIYSESVERIYNI